MIHEMLKVFICGPKETLPAVMAAVYGAGVLHIDPIPDSIREIPYIRPLLLKPEQKDELIELERIASLARNTIYFIKNYLKDDHLRVEWDPQIEIKDVMRIIEDVSRQTDQFGKDIKGKEQELDLYRRYEKILSVLTPIIERLPDSPFTEHTGITLYKKESSIEQLENLLERITDGRFEIYKRDIDEDIMVCVIIYPRDLGQKIRSLFRDENIGELRMPSHLTDLPLMESLKIIMMKIKELPEEILAIEEELRMLSSNKLNEMINCSRIVDGRLRQAEIMSGLYGTRDAFILNGWVPAKDFEKLKSVLYDEFQDMVVVEEFMPVHEEKERIPVLLHNPEMLRPFEVFTRFLSLPQYGTFDPTPVMAIFIPLFFGLILGDIGYGAVLFTVAVWIRRKWRRNQTVRDIASVFMINSTAALLFGILFGEFFGGIGESFGIHPYINRSELLMPFLIFSVVIGGLHIAVGLIIGIYMAIERREIKEGMCRLMKLSLVTVFFILSATFFGIVPETWRYNLILSGIGIMSVLVYLEKWIAPFDAMKLIVNTLSYARIMGFGVASVFLASIANQLTAIPQNIFIGIALGIFFHTINLIIAVYAPAVQALRLHYVEFFDKFFYPGGVEYRPFGGKQ